jgi:hypothetical protein
VTATVTVTRHHVTRPPAGTRTVTVTLTVTCSTRRPPDRPTGRLRPELAGCAESGSLTGRLGVSDHDGEPESCDDTIRTPSPTLHHHDARLIMIYDHHRRLPSPSRLCDAGQSQVEFRAAGGGPPGSAGCTAAQSLAASSKYCPGTVNQTLRPWPGAGTVARTTCTPSHESES